VKLLHVYRLSDGDWRPSEAHLATFAELAEPLGRSGWTVEVAWIGDAEMVRLNGTYRGKDGVTDVLSFGELEQDRDGVPDLGRDENGAAVDLWRGEADVLADAPIGELAIAPGFVRARCAERGWDLDDELALLVVHGLLHLLGWDHEEPAEAAEMRARETSLLAAAGRPHPMAER